MSKILGKLLGSLIIIMAIAIIITILALAFTGIMYAWKNIIL